LGTPVKVGIHERDQRDGYVEQVARQPRVAIEGLLRPGVEQTEIVQGSDPRAVEQRRRERR